MAQALAETETLYQMSKTIAQVKDQRLIAEVTLQGYLDVLNLPQGGVILFDHEQGFGTLIAHQEAGRLVEPGTQIPLENNLACLKMIETQEAVIVNDAQNDPLLAPIRSIVESLGYRSMLLMPIIVQGEVVGALGADSIESTHFFNQREVNLISSAADILALALENRWLFADLQKNLSEAKNHAQRLQVLNEMSQALSQTRTEAELHQILGQNIASVIDADRVSLALGTLEEGQMEVYALDGAQGIIPTGTILPLQGTSLGEAFRYKRVINVPDTRQYDFLDARKLSEQGVFSTLNAPLTVGDKILGTLNVGSLKVNAYTNNDMILLQQTAALVASMMENRRLFIQTETTLRDLQETDARLHQANRVVENSPVILFRWPADESLPVEYVSDNIRRFGYTPESFLSGDIPYTEIIHPDDRARISREVADYTQNNIREYTQEYRIITQDGRIRWVDDRTVVQRDENGQVVSYQGIVFDITERKQAEEALRTSQERLSLVINATGAGIWEWNIQDDSVYWSDGMAKMLGLGQEALIVDMERFGQMLHPDDAAMVQANIDKHFQDKTIYHVEQRIQHVDGHYRWLETIGQSVWNEAGEAIRLVGSSIDITARKEAEEELRRAKEVAEQANQLKTQFLSNMSHELRTPLNGIINLTGFVVDGILGEVNDQQIEALQTTIDGGQHLLSLINDILDLTKIEAGLMTVIFEDVNLNTELQGALATTKGLAKNKAIQIISQISPDLPLLLGDRRRIRQILLNLLSNAVKYTKAGEIRVSAQAENQGIYIRIEDTGIGIAPEDHERVFQSFAQAQNNQENVLSTGLGLPITKQLVELHNGKIWFDSGLNQGSIFHIYLPCRPKIDTGTLVLQTEATTSNKAIG